jgi:nucleoside-diphosphate-sugar epimerase
MESVVIGGSGIVGGYIVKYLVASGKKPIAVSRAPRSSEKIAWVQGDLGEPEAISLPPFDTIYCTTNASLFSKALPKLCRPELKRVVVFTTTSILTKMNSEIAAERIMLRDFAEAEQTIIATCEQLNIGWTILRPTLIYAEGRDRNITRMSKVIKRFGFMLLAGSASGLRQPVHAEDLAIGAIAAASSPNAINKTYSLSGGETVTYREMVGRIFDGLGLPRRMITIPLFAWKATFVVTKPFFSGFNVAMGTRMSKNMVFDHSTAREDFGWRPRDFHPQF